MKRYLLFCFEKYYPMGGWNDFAGSYDTLEEAKANAYPEFWHVIDSQTGEQVAGGHLPQRYVNGIPVQYKGAE